jgi:phosphoglycolate phosphatase-like HAD superfamily hydrolase
VRIAVDIDSTLHHYWDQLRRVAKRRFGVDLPYDQQTVWEIDVLRPEQVRAAVEETHRDEAIIAATPYPGAVETLRAWHDAGHEIHVMSERRGEAFDATKRWLDDAGFAYDRLHCAPDKVSRAA